MEKSKNKSDLLAAGRKKLQLYRQKKDNNSNQQQQKQRKSSSNKIGKSGSSTANTKSNVILVAERSTAADTDGVTLEELHEVKRDAPSKAVPTDDTDEPSLNLINLPLKDSPARLAGDIGEYAAVSDQDPVPVEIHTFTSRQASEGSCHVEGLERVDSSGLSVEDAGGVSSHASVGAMQGASCSSTDQHNENYRDDHEPLLQGESTNVQHLQSGSGKDVTGVHIDGDGAVEGNSVSIQCSISEGAQQHDETIYLEQVTEKAENASTSHVSLQTETLMQENERGSHSSTPVNAKGLGGQKRDPSTGVYQNSSADQEVYDVPSSENNCETEDYVPSTLSSTVTLAEENVSSSHGNLETELLINENKDERDRLSSTHVNVGVSRCELQGDPSIHVDQRSSADQEAHNFSSSGSNHETEGNHVPSSLIVETSKVIGELDMASQEATDCMVDNIMVKDGDASFTTQPDVSQELGGFGSITGTSPRLETKTICEKVTILPSSETSGFQYENRDDTSNYPKIEVEYVNEEVNKRVIFQGNCENDLGQQEESQEKLRRAISTGFCDRQGTVFSESCYEEEFECLKRHIYLTNLEKEFLSLQVEEQFSIHLDSDVHLSNELTMAHVLVKETQEQSTRDRKELSDCRSELHIMTLKKEELENSLASARRDVDTLNNKACEFQNKFEESEEGTAILLAELAECKVLLGDLRMENSRLIGDVIMETNEIKELNNEREHLIYEKSRLASEILEQKEQLDFSLNKQVQLDNDLKELLTFLEDLTEENISLSTSLNVFRCKLKDLSSLYQEIPKLQESSDQLRNPNLQGLIGENATHSSQTEHDKCNEESHLLKLKDKQYLDKDSVDMGALLVLQSHLNEFENVIERTESLIYSLHSHSMSLGRSDNKMSASGVSKLIRAFETKANTDVNLPAVPSIEGEKSVDSLIFATEQTQDLRDSLEQLGIDVEKVAALFKARKESTILAQELDVDHASCKLRIDNLEVKYVDQLNDYELVMDKLKNQISDISRNADEEAGLLLNQTEFLEKQVEKFSTLLESEKSTIRESFSEALEKLDASTGFLVSNNLDIYSHVNASVGGAVNVIDGLQEKLEGVHMELDAKYSAYETLLKDHVDMQKKQELSVSIMLRTHSTLKKLIQDHYQGEMEEIINEEAGDMLEVIQQNNEIVTEQLKKLLDDRLLLLHAKCKLESDLQSRNQHEEELKERYIVLTSNLENLLHIKVELESMLMEISHEMEGIKRRCFDLSKVLENHKVDALSQDVSDAGSSSCSTPLSHLEASVASFCQNYEEASEQISLSKMYLSEVLSLSEILDASSLPLNVLVNQELIPKLKELSDLQQRNHMLSSSILQQENEILDLKKSLGKLEEALENSRSELHVKVTELAELEQRLSSVREKLSIAVAKGKGLVVQRDSLKQSLLEKSDELERCLMDLQSKEAMLHEAEVRLKSYSEADRVEALESELSYIRNSATAFRDSFLLKDSILQRVEEVLEDLDLPEHFHSKDIIEKVEFLARTVAGKSSFLSIDEEQKNDEDQKNPLSGLYTEASRSVVGSWENLQVTSSTDLHDLRMKCAELQDKYYGLAEQNDMLEQSLMERNKLVKWWEEIVDRIEMPPNLRSIDLEFKIEWLINTLSELRQERDSLLLKMDNLEESNNYLESTLTVSERKLYELNSELATIKCEKEFLSESLDKLMYETLENSGKVIQDEDEKSYLQKEIVDLKEQLAEVNKDYHIFLNDIMKLRDLVYDALPNHNEVHSSSGDNYTKELERHLLKLVDYYKVLNYENSMGQSRVVCLPDQCNINHEEQKIKDMLESEINLVFLKTQLENVTYEFVLMKDEKDTNSEKLQSLILEMEATIKQKNVLLEDREVATNKYGCLALELDTICKKRDALQEQLNLEEQRSASLREKLNMAVKKGKALVQQRDSLKQTIEERTTELKQIENQLIQRASENLSLGNRLAQAEHSLVDSQQTIHSLSEALKSIDIGEEMPIIDPIKKFKEFVKLSGEWHAAAVSHELEAKKARSASDLLLAELNEVQERDDILQEELSKAETALAELSKQRDELEAAKDSALSQLEHFMVARSDERQKDLGVIKQLESGIFDIRKQCFSISNLLSRLFTEDSNIFSKLETSAQSMLKLVNGASACEQSVVSSSLQVSNHLKEEKSSGTSELFISENVDDSSLSEHLVLSTRCSNICVEELGDVIERAHKHLYDTEQQARILFGLMDGIERDVASQKSSSDSLRRELHHLEMANDQKDTEVMLLQKYLALLYGMCRRSIMEIENRKVRRIQKDMGSGVHLSEKMMALLELPDCIGEEPLGKNNPSFKENDIKKVGDILLSTVEGLVTLEDHVSEDNQKELKSMISDLQHELQDKDIQKNRMCGELSSQIKDAEATAKKCSEDLDSTRREMDNLEKKVKSLENDKELLEASSNDFQEKIKLLTNSMNLKDQEIEELVQALDEEESQLEGLQSRNQLLEKLVEEKDLTLESLEGSRAKAVTKLSNTMNKFDELHYLSESLLTEVENLQLQLQDRDSDISFLRKEVTRCTKDVLAEQEINKRNSIVICQLQNCLGTIASHFGVQDIYSSDEKNIQAPLCTEFLDRKVSSIVTKFDEVQKNCQKKESLLQLERDRIEEYLNKLKSLETTLHEKESQLQLFHQVRDSGEPSTMTSLEPLEIENMRKKGPVLTSVAPLIRSGRKANSDHVAVGIDLEQENTLQDEDDDKAHGFKALTMSRVVPKAARPITDRIDGLWVSFERLLMRQPSLRLVLIIYWVVLHTMLAASI